MTPMSAFATLAAAITVRVSKLTLDAELYLAIQRYTEMRWRLDVDASRVWPSASTRA